MQIKKFRQKLGMKAIDLAAIINVAPYTISRWERGTREPSYNNLKKMAKVLHVTPNDLLLDEHN